MTSQKLWSCPETKKQLSSRCPEVSQQTNKQKEYMLENVPCLPVPSAFFLVYQICFSVPFRVLLSSPLKALEKNARQTKNKGYYLSDLSTIGIVLNEENRSRSRHNVE